MEGEELLFSPDPVVAHVGVGCGVVDGGEEARVMGGVGAREES